jgi:hypothetical protein
MQQFKPVRLNLEKTLVAREFLDGGAVRQQRQTRFGGGLYFFEQILHGRIKWAQKGFKARNATRRSTGFVDNWIAGLLEKTTHPLVHKSINPIIQFLSVCAGFATISALAATK